MLSSLVFSVSYRCPIQCRYCGVYGGPHRKETMSLDYMCRMIDEVSQYEITRLVVFTGGEPFLLGKTLYQAVEHAAKRGLLTRIVTSAYWATSYEKARRVLTDLQAVGLTEINFSCDDFHQEFIPLERVRWANQVACEIGMPALLASKGICGSTITPPYLEEYFGHELTCFRMGEENPKNNVYSYSVTVPVGWGSEQLKEEELSWPKNDSHWQGPCLSVLDNIVLTPEGDLAACCGIGSVDIPETLIGNTHIKPLLTLLEDANHDLILNWLALEGPYGIMRFIQQIEPKISFHKRYVNNCHLCHHIFSRQETRDVLRRVLKNKLFALSLMRAGLEQCRPKLAQRLAGRTNSPKKEIEQ